MPNPTRPPLLPMALLLALALSPPASAQPAPTCGDPNADRSITACSAIIAANRPDPIARAAAYAHLGHAYLTMNLPDRAIPAFDEATRLNPRLAAAFKDRAAARTLKNQPEQAVADLSEAIRLAPNDAEAFNARGQAHIALRAPDTAIADFDEAIRLKPDYAQAFFNRGSAHGLKGQSGRAMADWTQAAKIDPSVLPGDKPAPKPAP